MLFPAASVEVWHSNFPFLIAFSHLANPLLVSSDSPDISSLLSALPLILETHIPPLYVRVPLAAPLDPLVLPLVCPRVIGIPLAAL